MIEYSANKQNKSKVGSPWKLMISQYDFYQFNFYWYKMSIKRLNINGEFQLFLFK